MILSLDKKSRESGERKDAGLIITTTVASPAFFITALIIRAQFTENEIDCIRSDMKEGRDVYP